jgi:hypothetical protein
MPIVSGGGAPFNGGTITNPLVIAPSTAGVVPLTLRSPPNGRADGANFAEWYDDADDFRGSLEVRGGLELDLGTASGGLNVFTTSFRQALGVIESAGRPVVKLAQASDGFLGLYTVGAAGQPTVTSGTVTPEQLALALQTYGALGGT